MCPTWPDNTLLFLCFLSASKANRVYPATSAFKGRQSETPPRKTGTDPVCSLAKSKDTGTRCHSFELGPTEKRFIDGTLFLHLCNEQDRHDDLDLGDEVTGKTFSNSEMASMISSIFSIQGSADPQLLQIPKAQASHFKQ